jgi:sucrose-6-phosphate hydrolase SacC (GH32 family)
MHWGHAVSTDLVHWQNLPIALAPDANGMIFSGSAVFDRSNTSGLGSAAHPPLVAIFTQHDADQAKAGSKTFQKQSIAYSLDAGRTWQKYAHNPVLPNPGFKDFRDPRVIWFEPTRRWVMVLAVGDHVAFYSSPDLIHWNHETDFGLGWGAHQGVWECPDLFPLKVEGEATQKFVLLVSVNPGGPIGGTATQYYVGDFDGHGFVPEKSSSSRVNWLDEGTDNYAGGTWSGIPARDGRRIFIGWMSNWLYGEAVPTDPWRSALTVPRQLTLTRGEDHFALRASPVRELESLRASSIRIAPQRGKGPFILKSRHKGSGGLELQLDLDAADARLITLEIANRLGQQVQFRINRELERYELDRSRSGEVGFNPNFAHDQYATLKIPGNALSLHVFIDSASIEIFTDDGQTEMTAVAFPSAPFDTLTLSADQPIQVKSGALRTLRSIWTNPSPAP